MSGLAAAERTQCYDIPLGHLEYNYIEKCKDIKELEKIVKVLRAGDEGKYPDLELFAEKRLEEIDPKNKVLWKEKPVSTPRDIESSEWEKITGDLEDWTSQMKTTEETKRGKQQVFGDVCDESLPPVRGQSQNISLEMENKAGPDESSNKKNKRVKPRDYREWDKFDIDAELAKVEDGQKNEENQEAPKTSNVLRKSSTPAIPDKLDCTGLSEQEIYNKATKEKEKGNEAFRAGDYEEAALYYSRSLSLSPSVAAYNNRAQAHLKLKEWDKALADCQTVLASDPGNLKGFLRRAVAYQGKRQFTNAKNDLQKVLNVEPGNKRAQDLLTEVQKLIQEQKVKGRRVVIEESDGSDSESEWTGKPVESVTRANESMMNGVNMHNSQVQDNTDKLTQVQDNTDKLTQVQDNTDKLTQVQDNTDKLKQNGEETKKEKVDCSEPKSEVLESSAKTNKDTQPTKPSTPHQPTQRKDQQLSESNTSSNRSGKSNKKKKKGKGCVKNEDGEKSVKPARNVEAELSEQVQQVPREPVEKQPGSEFDNSEKENIVAPQATATTTDGKVTASEPKVPEVPPQKVLPENVVQMKTLGNDMFKVGQYGEAIGHYDMAIDALKINCSGHEANLAVLYSNRAASRLKMGDCEGCVKDCNSSLQLQPASIKPLTRRAQAYEMMEKYRRAYVDFRQVLYLDFSVEPAVQGVNRCMKVLQDIDGPKWREKLPTVDMSGLSARKQYTTTVTPVTTPSDAPLSHTPQTTQHKAATKHPAQAKLSNKDLFENHKAEGNACVQKGDYAAAVSYYTKCISALPDQSAPYTNRALCNLRLNKPQEVLTDCDKALQLDPENIKALFRRAQAYKMLERYDESFKDLTCLLKKDQKNSSARREFQVVINYREQAKKARQEEERKKQQQNRTTENQSDKQRKRIQIQEVSDSSDSEADETVKAKPPANVVKPKSAEQKQNQIPSAKVNQKKAKSSKPDAKQNSQPPSSEGRTPEKTQDRTTKTKDTPKEKTSSAMEQGKGLSKDDISTPKPMNKTPYEFLQAWNALRTSKQIGPYAELLEQIEPEELPKVISNKLDGDMLHTIIRCVESLLDKGSSEGTALPSLFSRALGYLQQLTTVPRFSMVTLFMGEAEKSDLLRVVEKLHAGASCQYLQDDLVNLRKAYSL